MRCHRILGWIAAEGPQREWAGRAGLEVLSPASDYASVLRARPFDYLFSVNYPRKIPEAILKLAGRYAINLLDGPLPQYAGLNTPAWALINQERQHAICWHRMTVGINEGPVLKRRLVSIEPGETAFSLNTKCLRAAVASFAELVDELANGRSIEEPQGMETRRYFGRYSRPPGAALLDWSRPADELDALIRGLQFGPYANPLGSPKLILNGAPYIVSSARRELSAGGNARAGEFLRTTDGYLRIATGDGAALDVRAITNLRGHAIDIGELELQLGQRLTFPTKETVGRLTALDALLCRSEPFWSERLAGLQSVAAPLSHAPTRQSAVSKYTRRPLRLPAELLSKFPPGVAEATLFAILLARLERQSAFDLALSDAKWSERIRGLENMIAEEAFCRIRVTPGLEFGVLADAVGTEFRVLAVRGAWLHDLFARQPSLLAASGGTSDLPVGIALGRHPELWQPTTRRALTLVCSQDSGSSALLGHAGQFEPAELERLAVMFETLATGVAAAGLPRAMVDLPLMNQEMSHRITREWNRTDALQPADACNHSQSEQPAEGTPERTTLTPTEKALAELWRCILGLDRVGVEDNFFDSGGHSLLATRLISQIHERFGIEVPLRTFFECQTFGKLVEAIDALLWSARNQASPQPPGGEREEVLL
jgi:methionyl-tRNA formyltransferase/acyl carrier protein